MTKFIQKLLKKRKKTVTKWRIIAKFSWLMIAGLSWAEGFSSFSARFSSKFCKITQILVVFSSLILVLNCSCLMSESTNSFSKSLSNRGAQLKYDMEKEVNQGDIVSPDWKKLFSTATDQSLKFFTP